MLLSCCLFKKWSSRRRSRDSLRFPVNPIIQPNEPREIVISCAKCQSDQTMPLKAMAFVCGSCKCVNRVRLDSSTRERILSFIDCDVGDCQLIQKTPTIFKLGDTADGNSIPVCSVCLDGPGDMILENCGHGGICDDCARHIALNKAVGGAHCPLDKQEIVHILRIGELDEQYVKAREIELPELPQSEPPRVPPPVGLHKGKIGRDQGGGINPP